MPPLDRVNRVIHRALGHPHVDLESGRCPAPRRGERDERVRRDPVPVGDFVGRRRGDSVHANRGDRRKRAKHNDRGQCCSRDQPSACLHRRLPCRSRARSWSFAPKARPHGETKSIRFSSYLPVAIRPARSYRRADVLPRCSHPNLIRQPSGIWLPFSGTVLEVPAACWHPYLGRQPVGMCAPVHRAAASTEKCAGAGWTGAPPLDDQIDVAWTASRKTATVRVSATIPTIAPDRFCPPRTWVDMICLLPPGGTFARHVGERLLVPGFGTVAGSTTDRLRLRDASRTAGGVVRPVGTELPPLLLREAPPGDLARPRLPVGRIDVPAPRRSRCRDDDDAPAVGSE